MRQGERFNCATHLLGVVLAIAGSLVLLRHAARSGNDLKIAAASVFGLSMIALYAASTLYHGSQGPSKALWARVDRCTIYILIAGTYTPFALITLHGHGGLPLLSAIWGLCVLGAAKELAWNDDRVSSLPIYLVMGWLAVAAAVPLMRGLNEHGVFGLLAGGLLYTVGVIFYALDQRWRHAHGVWHLFVLAGTASHYLTVLNFVV